jgi:hypothetical protein
MALPNATSTQSLLVKLTARPTRLHRDMILIVAKPMRRNQRLRLERGVSRLDFMFEFQRSDTISSD